MPGAEIFSVTLESRGKADGRGLRGLEYLAQKCQDEEEEKAREAEAVSWLPMEQRHLQRYGDPSSLVQIGQSCLEAL